jgi:hypothetical protein
MTILTGFYNCGPTIAIPAKLVISASEVDSSDVATAGSAAVKISTCNGTNQPWSVNIAGSLSGDVFGSCADKDATKNCITTSYTESSTILGIISVMADTMITAYAD